MSGSNTKPQRKRARAPAKSVAAPAKQSSVADRPKRRVPIAWIAFGVVAVALVAAILLSGGAGSSETRAVSVTGTPLLEFIQPAGDPAIGMQAPVVAGVDFADDPVTIGRPGSPAAIVFVAHWCSHCQAEVPRIQAWLDSTGGVPGVDLVSVATRTSSARPNYPPSAWLEREGWTPPVLVDDAEGTAHAAFGSGGFPFMVFLNSDGTVAARISGEMDTATLQSIMESLS